MPGSELYRQHHNFLAGVTQYYPLYLPGAKTFFVAPTTYTAVGGMAAADGNDGESPQAPLLTIDRANTIAVASRGDTICLMPGTYTLTAAQALTRAACRLVALKPYSATITGDGVITTLLTVDVNDIEFAGLRLLGVAALTRLVDLANTTAIRNFHMHHCKVIGLETVAGVTGIQNGENGAGNDAAHTIIEYCEFEGLSAQPIHTFGGGTKIHHCVVNLDDTAAATGVRVGDMGAAFGTRKALDIYDVAFIGQTNASTLLAITFAGTEANTQMWSARECSFASCAAPTADIHPEGAAGANYVGTTTTTAPTLWPA